VAGGVPGLTATADEVYARTYPRLASKTAEYYRRYPDDIAAVRRIADHLDANDVRLPDGDRLTTRRLRVLGNAFGMSDGYERVHWIIEEAFPDASPARSWPTVSGIRSWPRPGSSTPRCSRCRSSPTAGATARPRGPPTGHSPRIRTSPRDADPLLFTGEMMYSWMFDEIRGPAALRRCR